MRGRDFISDMDFSKEEIETVIDVALKLKRDCARGAPHALLRDKTLALLFFFTSTRTRASFETGLAQLGGHAAFIDSTTTQISHGDTATEIGEIYGRYFDLEVMDDFDAGFKDADIVYPKIWRALLITSDEAENRVHAQKAVMALTMR
ncbi:MAG: hypothetical protein WDZ49_16900 [Litorilinea sp.]